MKYTNQYDEWIECTGVMPKATSYYNECKSMFQDADEEIFKLKEALIRARDQLKLYRAYYSVGKINEVLGDK